MDVARLGRALWRFKYLVGGGILLAAALAVLTVARVSFAGGVPKLQYRSAVTYQSSATVFVTQPGFPGGRTSPRYIPGNAGTGTPLPSADADRLSILTSLYAQVAMSDSVRSLIPKPQPNRGQIIAAAVTAPQYSTPAVLPILKFWTTARSPAAAVRLANAATSAFQRWLIRDQQANGVPASDRVEAQIISSGSPPTAVSHHSKSLAIMVFLAVAAATIALVLGFENVRTAAPVRPSGPAPPEPSRNGESAEDESSDWLELPYPMVKPGASR